MHVCVCVYVCACMLGIDYNKLLCFFFDSSSLLEELGHFHLVPKICGKFQDQQSSVQKPRAPPTSASDFDSGMVSVQSGSLPPSPKKQITPRKSSRAASRPHSSIWSTVEESLQPLHSPITKAPALPLQETQEEEDKRGLVFSTVTQSTPTSISVNNQSPLLGAIQPETVNTELQTENQELREDNVSLGKEVQDKDCEIRELKEKVRLREKELQDCKAKTAELEQKLQQKDEESKEQKIRFSEHEKEIRRQHEKEINELKEQLSKEKEKVEKKEIEIRGLENQLLQKEIEKLTLIDKHKDKVRLLEKQRDEIKVNLAEEKSKVEECRRLTAEKEKEDAEQRAIVAEKKCSESVVELNRLKQKFKISDGTS